MMSNRGLARQANGKLISANEHAMRTVCKRCGRFVYAWQTTEWQRAPRPGLVHADPEECGE